MTMMTMMMMKASGNMRILQSVNIENCNDHHDDDDDNVNDDVHDDDDDDNDDDVCRQDC